MIQVYIARDADEASRVCQRLLAAGLNAVVQGGAGADVTLAYPAVWVSEEDAERAHELLRDWAAAGGDEPD